MTLTQPTSKRLRKFDGLASNEMTPDIGVVINVNKVSQVYTNLNEQGSESTEFENELNRVAHTVDVSLFTRTGTISKVPYFYSSMNGSGFCGGVPIQDQMVLIIYITNKRIPIAIGGGTRWQEVRRLISSGQLPELKDGEVLLQSAIRENPMTWFGEQGVTKEKKVGARVYIDFKGRLITEARHYRDGNGAFVRTVLGNPASTTALDETNDFNDQDELTDSYIVMQSTVAANENSDPLFKMNVTQDGKVTFQFQKAWIGRGSSLSNGDPDTTIEVDVENKQVLIDGNVIKAGRDATEKAVLGDTLVTKMGELIDLILAIKQPGTPAGTTGPPINSLQFQQLKSSLSAMLSNTNLVE